MESLSIETAVKKIQIYLRRDDMRPYFVIADSATECAELKKIFSDFEQIYISDFCASDSPLDTDLLVEKLRITAGNAICFGLGEYVYFTGQENILRSLQDKTFGRRVIFVCRGVANELERLADEDGKFRANHLCKIAGDENFSVVKYNPAINFETDAQNFSELLRLMEREQRTSLTVKSYLPLVNVREINSFHDAIKNLEPNFSTPINTLNDEQWREYFFDDKCDGYPSEHWRTFAASFKGKISVEYLQHVAEHSANYEEYRKNLFFGLLDVDDEKNFGQFYSQRKKILRGISLPYLDEYLEQLTELPPDLNVVRYLTDNTLAERQAMIQAVQGKEKIPAILRQNYPAMDDYLTDYDFGDAAITKYFRRYKQIKLCNVDDGDFLAQVEAFAKSRPYNKFETRRAILDRIGTDSKLYWLDALGVEFLSCIVILASHAQLTTKTMVARAEMPTLTSQNKDFFDDWSGEKFPKNQRLDDLKHAPETFVAGKCSAPLYICDELEIIAAVVDEIKNTLTQRKAKKVVLTSDHGASRLAVMYGRGRRYKVCCKGEHSGRCCPTSEIDDKPECATEENGYWVLANYDRFAGGRMSSVEVHGGATLEEILVPVIEFTLAGETVKKNSPQKKIPGPTKKIHDGFDFFK